MADALSRLGELEDTPWNLIAAVSLARRPAEMEERVERVAFSIEADQKLLGKVRAGYAGDKWVQKVLENRSSFSWLSEKDRLLFYNKRLIIPRVPEVQELLHSLAHDNLGHFGTDKSYDLLHNSYYWPNMYHDLTELYIPSCEQCQRNKSPTNKPAGPLHPLPIPDQRGDSVAMDFIGPLPLDQGFD